MNQPEIEVYECHITVGMEDIEVGDKKFHHLEDLARFHKWKTSYIDGDPLLGDKRFFYFTRYAKNFQDMKIKMNKMADVLIMQEFPVVREKIEGIVYDTKKELVQ